MACKKKKTKAKGKKRITPKAEDARSRKKYAKGGRIEAYTFGEAQRSKRWP